MFPLFEECVARFCKVSLNDVRSEHFAKMMNLFPHVFERLFLDPQTGKLKDRELIARELSTIWLRPDDPIAVELAGQKAGKLRSCRND